MMIPADVTPEWFFSARVAIAIPHVALNLDQDLVFNLRAGHENHKALDASNGFKPGREPNP
jgi:hypothetical protein